MGKDGEDAPVGAGVGGEAELLEDLVDVSFDSALGDEQAVGDGPVGQPLGRGDNQLTMQNETPFVVKGNAALIRPTGTPTAKPPAHTCPRRPARSGTRSTPPQSAPSAP